MRTSIDISSYLERINYDGPLDATAATLTRLHRAHLLTVPFENLDIKLGRPIVLNEQLFFDKIVTRRRGGFCFELNGLFAAVLRELGFSVGLLSARVPDAQGHPRCEFDHLALRVDVKDGDNEQSSWLADVGFGDCFLEPLRLVAEAVQPEAGVSYRLVSRNGRWKVERCDQQHWNLVYDFTLAPHRLDEFAGMCHYHQTSPDSPFTARSVCSRMTPRGRITLADMRLIWTDNGNRRERILTSDAEYRATLKEHFGITLDGAEAAASQKT